MPNSEIAAHKERNATVNSLGGWGRLVLVSKGHGDRLGQGMKVCPRKLKRDKCEWGKNGPEKLARRMSRHITGREEKKRKKEKRKGKQGKKRDNGSLGLHSPCVGRK